MTTSLPHTHIRLRDLSELVGGIPHVLGYPPTDSLVLFTFRRCPELVLSTTIRVDLPKPEHVPLLVSELADAVARNRAVAAIAVVVGEKAAEQHAFIEALRLTLADTNTLLTHASWVRTVAEGEQWQCYDEPLCTGTVPDPHTSALSAATAVAGGTVFPNREALTGHLAPDAPEALARRRTLIDAYRSTTPTPYSEPEVRADLDTLGHALDKVTNSRALPTFTDHELARLGAALSRQEVRDECMAIALSTESQPAERLWTVLARALPTPERATAAFLLAISSYLRGSGIIAALALNITMKANPNHKTAPVLDYALQKGTPPGLLRAMIAASITRNQEDTTTPPPDDDPPWDTTPAKEKLPMENRDDRDLTSTEQPTQPPPASPTSPVLTRSLHSDDDPDEAQSQLLAVSLASSASKPAVQSGADLGGAQCQPQAVSLASSALEPAGQGDADLGEARLQPQAVSLASSALEPAVQGGADLGEARCQPLAVSLVSSALEPAVQGDVDLGEARCQPLAVSLVSSALEPAGQGDVDFGKAPPHQPPVSRASSALDSAARSRESSVALPQRVVSSSVLGRGAQDGESGVTQPQRPADSPTSSVFESGVRSDAEPQVRRVVGSSASWVLDSAVQGGESDVAQSQRPADSPTPALLARGGRDGGSGEAQRQRVVGPTASWVSARAGRGLVPPRRVVVSRASSAPEPAVQGDGHPEGTQLPTDRDPVPVEPTGSTVTGMAGPAGLPRVAPGPLSQRAATALGIPAGRVVAMDPLTAFLPPPTERSDPW